MSTSEDHGTPVDDVEEEGDGSEATSPRKRNGSSAQGGDGPNAKRFRIITEEEEYKWSLPQDMASYANDNSEKYIPEKDVKEAILIKTPRPENLDPPKKLDDYLQELLKQKKRSQDIVIDNTLEKVQDKVLNIVGPLLKLWVMVEQVNSGSASGSSSTVEMDTVLELLEKTVLLIGQCSNTITYERRKNALLGVTGTSSSQVASILKEKAAFLQKHDQALFGKDFRDHLTESLKAKKQSIEAITEVSKSTNRKRPFREGPSFYQGRPNGGQKFRSNYNGKYILFRKKGTPSQQQPDFTSSYDKHGGFNSCSSNTKKIIFQTKNSKMCSSREDKGISPSLETTHKRSRALGFSRRLPNSSSNGTSTG